jgi:tryptophan synthase alpha chain
VNRIQNAFLNKKVFIGFLTAGDPSAAKTVEYALAMESAGADLIELGIPFSDPVAEGPVIQNANTRALRAGMTTDGAFDVAAKIREKSQIPLVFLTYLNPVFHYGLEAFFAKARRVGIDGIIIPDLPFEEKNELLPTADKYGVSLISLIAPTSEGRVKMIAKDAKGFIYIVSSMGVTGVRSKIETDLSKIVKAVRAVTDTPVAIGFGINTPAQAAEFFKIADGVIVGSAIVRIIERYGENAAEPLKQYIVSMKSLK